MLTKDGPKVLEFNARFGDPEAQVYLMRLENDLLDLLEACVDGGLERMELRWRPDAAVCVVMASAGYPGTSGQRRAHPRIGGGGPAAEHKNFSCRRGAARRRVVTHGGRVLGVTAWDARAQGGPGRAYEAVAKIQFDGAQFRRDIGAKALSFVC